MGSWHLLPTHKAEVGSMTPPPCSIPGHCGRWDVKWNSTMDYAHHEYGEKTDLWLRSDVWRAQRRLTIAPPPRKTVGQSLMGFAKAIASVLL